jgi:hypothetical protein
MERVELLKKFPCPQVSEKFQLSHEAFFWSNKTLAKVSENTQNLIAHFLKILIM